MYSSAKKFKKLTYKPRVINADLTCMWLQSPINPSIVHTSFLNIIHKVCSKVTCICCVFEEIIYVMAKDTDFKVRMLTFVM